MLRSTLIILKRIIGVALMLLGVIFLLTPLTPGSLIFLFVGAELAGLTFLIPERIRKMVPWAKKNEVTEEQKDDKTTKDS